MDEQRENRVIGGRKKAPGRKAGHPPQSCGTLSKIGHPHDLAAEKSATKAEFNEANIQNVKQSENKALIKHLVYVDMKLMV